MKSHSFIKITASFLFITAISAAPLTAACFNEIECTPFPTLYSPSNLKVVCEDDAYPSETKLCNLIFDDDITICFPTLSQLGSAKKRTENGVAPAELTCGVANIYEVDCYTKIEDLPPVTTGGSVTITIGGVSVTLPVEVEKKCSVYQPILPSTPSDYASCGGNAATTNSECNEE